MKNVTRWTGVVAAGLVSVAVFAGCASSPDGTPATNNTTGGTAGTGGAGGATGGVGGAGAAGTLGMAGGTHLKGAAAFVFLSGESAAPGPTAAPAPWTNPDIGCNICHGPAGEGVKPIAPEIRHTPTEYSTWVVRHGRVADGMPTGMVAFPLTTTDPVKMPAITGSSVRSGSTR